MNQSCTNNIVRWVITGRTRKHEITVIIYRYLCVGDLPSTLDPRITTFGVQHKYIYIYTSYQVYTYVRAPTAHWVLRQEFECTCVFPLRLLAAVSIERGEESRHPLLPSSTVTQVEYVGALRSNCIKSR